MVGEEQEVGTPGRLRIGEIAAEFGLNPKSIRFYEGIGLLPSPRRADNGYRWYDDSDRERLRFIQQAKAVGLTLAEMREILDLRSGGTRPCERVQRLLDQKIATIDQQLQALADMRQELVQLRATVTDVAVGRICGIIEGYARQPERERARIVDVPRKGPKRDSSRVTS